MLLATYHGCRLVPSTAATYLNFGETREKNLEVQLGEKTHHSIVSKVCMKSRARSEETGKRGSNEIRAAIKVSQNATYNFFRLQKIRVCEIRTKTFIFYLFSKELKQASSQDFVSTVGVFASTCFFSDSK